MGSLASEGGGPASAVGFTDGSVFEALFLRGVDTPADLREALLGIGVDLSALQPRYPSMLWIAAIDLARGYLYPTSTSLEPAERELGRKFFAGYLRTVSGKLLGAVLPFMTIASVLHRLPRYVRMGRDDLQIEVREEAPGRVRLLVSDPATARPWFFVGLVEAGLDRLTTPYLLELTSVDAFRFEALVTWSTS